MFSIGAVAGVLIFLAYALYIKAILEKKTKPNRATWFMLTVISLVITLSYSDLGATDTLWPAIADLAGTVIIAILALFYFGSGGWNSVDRYCIFVAFACLGLYLSFSEHALFVLVVTLVMDAAAMTPTIKHAYEHPQEEDTIAWTVTFIANVVTLFAISTWTIDIALYPLYMLIINGAILSLVYRQCIFKVRAA